MSAGLGCGTISTGRAITNLTGPTGDAICNAFSPDGRLLAVGSADHTVRLWELAAFKPFRVLTNDNTVQLISFSSDSRILVIAPQEADTIPAHESRTRALTGEPTFWDVNTGRKLPGVPQAGTECTAVACSHRGTDVALGYANGMVQLWDFKDYRKRAEFKKHSQSIWTVAFSGDDLRLASGGADGDVIVYDLAEPRASEAMKDHTSRVWSVAFAPDGKSLASGSADGTIKLWNVATHHVALTLRDQSEHLGAISSIAFSPDGNLLVDCGADDVRLWSAAPVTESSNAHASSQ